MRKVIYLNLFWKENFVSICEKPIIIEKKGRGLSIYNYFINIKFIIIKKMECIIIFQLKLKFYDYLASFWKGGFERVKIMIKGGGNFEKVLKK
jgi:hypothetical protein